MVHTAAFVAGRGKDWLINNNGIRKKREIKRGRDGRRRGGRKGSEEEGRGRDGREEGRERGRRRTEKKGKKRK